MVKYRAVREIHHCPESGTYTAWGIKGWLMEDREQTVIAYIPDLFQNRGEAEHFADLCTQLHIAIAHLPDVVEDYLAR